MFKKLIVLLGCFSLLVLVACTDEEVDVPETEIQTETETEISEDEATEVELSDDDTEIYEEVTDTDLVGSTPNPPATEAPAWTIEELGEIIVAGGIFWEDWWRLRGAFATEHIDWEEGHLQIYNRVLPSSGFSSLDDIRSYLLQYYTEAVVNTQLSGEIPIFVEYNSNLYMNSGRMSSMHPDWENATHIIIEQSGNLIVVETTVLVYVPETGAGEEVQYRFTFIDGRIDSAGNSWRWFDE